VKFEGLFLDRKDDKLTELYAVFCSFDRAYLLDISNGLTIPQKSLKFLKNVYHFKQ